MRFVFDASAALAVLLGEARGDELGELVEDGCISSVNVAEVATVLIRRGGAPEQIRLGVGALGLLTLNLTPPLAIEAGLIWPATKAAGSSLGDRCALVLSRTLRATLLTSDTRLAAVAPAVNVAVRLLQVPGPGTAR